METIAIEVLKSAVSEIVKKRLKQRGSNTSEIDFENLVSRHLISSFRWSEDIQFLGLSTPRLVNSNTIRLKITDMPRRFSVRGNRGITMHEDDLIKDDNSYVLLGDPGSGKTTTLKRIVQRLLVSESDSGVYEYMPIVIRLREIENYSFLYVAISDTLKIPYKIEINGDDARYTIQEGKLDDFVYSLINEIRCCLILDGIDEMPASARNKLIDELQIISYDYNIKVIATCRSADFVRFIQGYRVTEIQPLTDDQIVEISSLWLGDATSFVKELGSTPYHDVANRPLLLCTLVYIYQLSEALPDQPSSVYRTLVRLLLTEWSEQRGIIRISQYAGLDNDRKLEFLSHLSYWITVQFKSKSFTTEALEIAYQSLAPRFKLPMGEAGAVAREIESHTGIITKVSDHYEFSHLSLQEFLAANHIVRMPLTKSFYNYIENYPHPAAIAVAISADPALWLAVTLANDEVIRSFNLNSFSSFISRLKLEKPNLIPSYDLGYAVLKLIGYMSTKFSSPNSPIDGYSESSIEELTSIPGIFDSICMLIRISILIEVQGGTGWYIHRSYKNITNEDIDANEPIYLTSYHVHKYLSGIPGIQFKRLKDG
ncbi:NACHT domain-containing protein [Rubrivirga marina]|uniref:NACHT domain-containing protein n=1 Tax=Rubrivirga marina TaxID=1196024 RepID=UPI000BA8F6D7|nr:NACHT domain-containing protein [Rubrivirga marina]